MSTVRDTDPRYIAPATFEELYEKYYRNTYHLCLKMMANVFDAEDMAHEVMLQAFRKLKSFKGKAMFSSWLFRVTTNHVRMYWRKCYRRPESMSYSVNNESTIDAEIFNSIKENGLISDNFNNMVNMVDKIALLNALDRLPAGYKIVYVLHDVLGLEHQEIADYLGITSGTSKSQLHKARLHLQAVISGKLNKRSLKNSRNNPPSGTRDSFYKSQKQLMQDFACDFLQN